MATLTSIMSSTGSREVGRPTPEAMMVLTQPPPTTREEAIERSVGDQQIIGSPVHFDEEYVRLRAAEAYDRSFYPEGAGRQLAAIFAAGNRTHQLAEINAPTLVIHGAEDTLIRVSGGEHTADVIPDSKLLILDEMGHDLPRPLWSDVLAAITKHVAEAG